MAIKQGLRKQATLVVIGDSITFASGFFSAIILARVIPVGEMGTYRQLLYLCSFSVTLTEMGLSTSIYRFWNAIEKTKRNSYAKMLMIISLFLGTGASLLLALLSGLLSNWYHNADLKLALLITALYPLATIPMMTVRPILLSQGYSMKATLLETVFSLVSVFSIVFPLLLGVSLILALEVWMAVSLLRLLILPVIFRKYLFTKGSWWDWSLSRDLWYYVWPLQVARLPGYVLGYLDKVIMSIYLIPKEFATYSLGAREIPFIGTIGPSISNVLIPHLVKDLQEGHHGQICRRWRISCEKTAMLTYLIAAFCIWHAVPIVQFLFSSTYIESSVPFRIFSFLIFVRVIEYASLAKVFGKTNLIMHSSFISAGTLVSIAFFLTWLWGPFGMALSFLIATLSSAIYLLICYKRMLCCPISDFFPWHRLLLLLFIAMISTAIGSELVSHWIAMSNETKMIILGWKLGVLFSFSGLIYLGLLIVLGFLKPKTIFEAFLKKRFHSSFS